MKPLQASILENKMLKNFTSESLGIQLNSTNEPISNN
jgi:hypothetical protein